MGEAPMGYPTASAARVVLDSTLGVVTVGSTLIPRAGRSPRSIRYMTSSFKCMTMGMTTWDHVGGGHRNTAWIHGHWAHATDGWRDTI